MAGTLAAITCLACLMVLTGVLCLAVPAVGADPNSSEAVDLHQVQWLKELSLQPLPQAGDCAIQRNVGSEIQAATEESCSEGQTQTFSIIFRCCFDLFVLMLMAPRLLPRKRRGALQDAGGCLEIPATRAGTPASSAGQEALARQPAVRHPGIPSETKRNDAHDLMLAWDIFA